MVKTKDFILTYTPNKDGGIKMRFPLSPEIAKT
jgi:hypothetical protein